MKKLGSLTSLLSLVLIAGCSSENASRNLDGSCKSGFVDAYNATVEATNKANEKVKALNRTGLPSGAELADAEITLKDAQRACKNILENYSGNGDCEANRTAKAEDHAENCSVVDENLKKIQKAKQSRSELPASSFRDLSASQSIQSMTE